MTTSTTSTPSRSYRRTSQAIRYTESRHLVGAALTPSPVLDSAEGKRNAGVQRRCSTLLPSFHAAGHEECHSASHFEGSSMNVSPRRGATPSGGSSSSERLHTIGRRHSTLLPRTFAKGHEAEHASSNFAGGSMMLSDRPSTVARAATHADPSLQSPRARPFRPNVMSKNRSQLEGSGAVLSPRASEQGRADVQAEVAKWKTAAVATAEITPAGSPVLSPLFRPMPAP